MEYVELEVKLWNRSGMDIFHLLEGKSKDGVALAWTGHGPWSNPLSHSQSYASPCAHYFNKAGYSHYNR